MVNRTRELDRRLTFSLPQGDHDYLRLIAQEKRVSMGWVIREAVRDYLKTERDKSKVVEDTHEQSLF